MHSQADDVSLPVLIPDIDDHRIASCSPAFQRERSGFLTPSSENSLNPDDVFDELRKADPGRLTQVQGIRKRSLLGGRLGHMRSASYGSKNGAGNATMVDLLKDKFVVRPFPSSLNHRPRSLTPLMLLPRASLPLSALDLSSSVLPASRLFESNIKILELESRVGNTPVVLIARLDGSSSSAPILIAVEHESKGRYTLCPLGNWVNIEKLRLNAVVARHDLNLPSESKVENESNAFVSAKTIESSKIERKKRLAIEEIQSLIKRPRADSRPPTPLLQQETQMVHQTEKLVETSNVTQLDTQQPELTEPLIANVAAKRLTADEIFDNLRTQYLESLYVSKTALAYFAKGPLSRARAAFYFDFDAVLNMTDLVEFMQSLVLSASLADKKYKTTLPEMLGNFDLDGHSADEGTKQPKKRTKKVKLGKNGLYPTESSYIKQWWSTMDREAEMGAPGATREEFAKKKIGQLRVRETQLQIIIILEVLSLQSSATPENDELPTSGALEESTKTAEVRKPKKKLDLPLLIEMHIDRLCIWQSTALEEKASLVSQSQQQKPKHIAVDLVSDILRDFCVEVIVPFYSARLPEQCGMINRRLGGPVVVSPARPTPDKSSSTSRPGAIAKRPVPVKPRRSLQHVISEERRGRERSTSRGPSAAISLMRSASTPLLPSLKREGSIKREPSEAPSLSNTSAESQPLLVSRGGVLNSKRFSQREVDLSAVPKVAESKAKKQAVIESELKNAISALRKPNRELAGKLFADGVEKRLATVGPHPRKSKKPVRNPLFETQNVQILATPAKRRHREVFEPRKHASQQDDDDSLPFIPPSSIPRVEESVRRSSHQVISSWQSPLLSRNVSQSDPNSSRTVQATPRRDPTRVSSFAEDLASAHESAYCPPSSPLQARRRSTVASACLQPQRPPQMSGYESDTNIMIQATPVKTRPHNTIAASVEGTTTLLTNQSLESELSAEQGTETTKTVVKEESIYKALGWDDDCDDFV